MESMVGGCIKRIHDLSSLQLLVAIVLVTVLLLSSSSTCCSGITNGSLNCKGSVGDCYGEEEFAMESEVSRRILQGQQYITYPGLDRGACNNPSGMPYTQGSGCLSDAVNPHTRGCEMINRCPP